MHPLAQDLDHVLAHTEDVWDSLRGQTVFITGGTGFVGTWLVESFVWANERLDLNARAVLLTRNPEAFRRKAPTAAQHRSVEMIRGDCLTFDFPDVEFPFVIHAATAKSVESTTEEPTGTFERDVAATKRLLEFARMRGARRFLLTSSGAVYGKQPPELMNIPEDYPGAPSTVDAFSSYGQAKRVSEFLCAAYARQFGFDAIIARLFAFAGPHLPLDANFAIGNFVCDVLAGVSVRITGDGTSYRSYLYAADLAVWLWNLLIHGKSARPYNVGSEEAVSIAELARVVVENTVPGTPIEISQSTIPGAVASRYVPSVERARTELKLAPLIPLDQAIRRMYRWHG